MCCLVESMGRIHWPSVVGYLIGSLGREPMGTTSFVVDHAKMIPYGGRCVQHEVGHTKLIP